VKSLLDGLSANAKMMTTTKQRPAGCSANSAKKSPQNAGLKTTGTRIDLQIHPEGKPL